jgi:hypothetical protein
MLLVQPFTRGNIPASQAVEGELSDPADDEAPPFGIQSATWIFTGG